MIFLDTSAIYALSDIDDAMHDQALRMFESAESDGEEIVTHNYVLSESAALLQRRLGLQSSLKLLAEAGDFTVIWVDESLHDNAVEYMRRKNSAKLSLVDAVSFQVMTVMGITKYLGFDKHFSDAGFSPYCV